MPSLGIKEGRMQEIEEVREQHISMSPLPFILFPLHNISVHTNYPLHLAWFFLFCRKREREDELAAIEKAKEKRDHDKAWEVGESGREKGWRDAASQFLIFNEIISKVPFFSTFGWNFFVCLFSPPLASSTILSLPCSFTPFLIHLPLTSAQEGREVRVTSWRDFLHKDSKEKVKKSKQGAYRPPKARPEQRVQAPPKAQWYGVCVRAWGGGGGGWGGSVSEWCEWWSLIKLGWLFSFQGHLVHVDAAVCDTEHIFEWVNGYSILLNHTADAYRLYLSYEAPGGRDHCTNKWWENE